LKEYKEDKNMLVKDIISAEKAVEMIKKGDSVMVGGFLDCGAPEDILAAMNASDLEDLTLICNDSGIYNPDGGKDGGVSGLVAKKKFSKIIASHVGTNRETGNQMNSGETEVVLVPQGTLAERIRAAGVGLGGILTPTGVGTEVEEGKQVIELGGKKFILEEPLRANVAVIKAKIADKAGNLVYSQSARNFNPIMAMAADLVIVEAEEIVEVGEINPEHVITPSIFVNYIVKSK
jgi:acetate CoA/acetoacetate CoA-transferase alpha subunit